MSEGIGFCIGLIIGCAIMFCAFSLTTVDPEQIKSEELCAETCIGLNASCYLELYSSCYCSDRIYGESRTSVIGTANDCPGLSWDSVKDD